MARIKKFTPGGKFIYDNTEYIIDDDLINALYEHGNTLTPKQSAQFSQIIDAVKEAKNSGKTITYDSVKNELSGVEFEGLTKRQNKQLETGRSTMGQIFGSLWGGKGQKAAEAINSLKGFTYNKPVDIYDASKTNTIEYEIDPTTKQYKKDESGNKIYLDSADSRNAWSSLSRLIEVLPQYNNDTFKGYNGHNYDYYKTALQGLDVQDLERRAKLGQLTNSEIELLNDLGYKFNGVDAVISTDETTQASGTSSTPISSDSSKTSSVVASDFIGDRFLSRDGNIYISGLPKGYSWYLLDEYFRQSNPDLKLPEGDYVADRSGKLYSVNDNVVSEALKKLKEIQTNTPYISSSEWYVTNPFMNYAKLYQGPIVGNVYKDGNNELWYKSENIDRYGRPIYTKNAPNDLGGWDNAVDYYTIDNVEYPVIWAEKDKTGGFTKAVIYDTSNNRYVYIKDGKRKLLDATSPSNAVEEAKSKWWFKDGGVIKADNGTKIETESDDTKWYEWGAPILNTASLLTSGVPVLPGVIGALGSAWQFGSDIAKDGFQWSDVGNLGANLSMDALGLFGLPSGVVKIGKTAKPIAKIAKTAKNSKKTAENVSNLRYTKEIRDAIKNYRNTNNFIDKTVDVLKTTPKYLLNTADVGSQIMTPILLVSSMSDGELNPDDLNNLVNTLSATKNFAARSIPKTIEVQFKPYTNAKGETISDKVYVNTNKAEDEIAEIVFGKSAKNTSAKTGKSKIISKKIKNKRKESAKEFLTDKSRIILENPKKVYNKPWNSKVDTPTKLTWDPTNPYAYSIIPLKNFTSNLIPENEPEYINMYPSYKHGGILKMTGGTPKIGFGNLFSGLGDKINSGLKNINWGSVLNAGDFLYGLYSLKEQKKHAKEAADYSAMSQQKSYAHINPIAFNVDPITRAVKNSVDSIRGQRIVTSDSLSSLAFKLQKQQQLNEIEDKGIGLIIENWNKTQSANSQINQQNVANSIGISDNNRSAWNQAEVAKKQADMGYQEGLYKNISNYISDLSQKYNYKRQAYGNFALKDNFDNFLSQYSKEYGSSDKKNTMTLEQYVASMYPEIYNRHIKDLQYARLQYMKRGGKIRSTEDLLRIENQKAYHKSISKLDQDFRKLLMKIMF